MELARRLKNKTGMISKTLGIAAFLMLGLTGINANALVDLKNANFSDTWVDLVVPGSGFDLRVQRAYNSRTLYNGMFGFGWCSDFETSLDITPEGNLKLTECGAGLEINYEAHGFSEKDIDKTIKGILEKAHAENATAPSKYFNDLEKRLKSDPALRAEYATKYNVVRQIADKTRFYANGKETDYVEKNGNYYSRVLSDGTTQKFNLKGKLEKVYDKNSNYLTLTYDGRMLRDVTDNNGRKIVFSYFENGKVKNIAGPNSLKVEYKFKNMSDLVWVKATSGQIFTYDYDDLHNMTKISFPDKTTKEMGYNKNMDWITSFKDIDGCLETYDYHLSDDKPKDHFWANVQKTCAKKVVLKAKYEFWYDYASDKAEKFLKKSRTVENNTTTDVTYNEVGKPVLMARNNKTTKYEYFDNGLLKKKVTPDGVVTLLKYDNPFKKVSSVTRGKKTSDFTYDPKGNLVKATNTDGQRISLAYDLHGRIAMLEDQARRKVTIKYEDRFGKPTVIDREGVGTINVTYNPKGEIDKVTSPAGSSVAIQVASAFSNLLDLVQPAGVNLAF